jgi:ABC-2 type transport system ATP-binding protein
MGGANFQAYGEVMTQTEAQVTLRVSKSETARVTSKLLADLPIIDLTVEDPPFEDVIEQVFSQEIEADESTF